MKKNKEKYDLNTLKVKWTPQTVERRFFTIKLKSDERTIFSKEMTPTETGTSAYNAWLEEEYDPKILTDKEKAYLSAVIKPFRERTIFVKKVCCMNDEKEFIYVEFGSNCFTFPFFTKGTMYTGMEYGKEYTLKELGL